MCNVIVSFFESGQIIDLTSDFSAFNFPVRSFNQSKIIHARIACKMSHEADVRTFRRLNGTNATVMRWVHITNFKTGSLASKTPGTERRETPFMLKLRENIHLIHKLGKLISRKKFFENRHKGTGIYELHRSKRISFES